MFPLHTRPFFSHSGKTGLKPAFIQVIVDHFINDAFDPIPSLIYVLVTDIFVSL